MNDINSVLSNFNDEFKKLDIETQIKLDDFIQEIEEVGYHLMEGMNFRHDEEFLNTIWPALQAICSTISSKKTAGFNGNFNIELTWEPYNFIIPPDSLARSNEQYKIKLATAENDDLFPLVRTASGPSVYNYEDDTVFSR